MCPPAYATSGRRARAAPDIRKAGCRETTPAITLRAQFPHASFPLSLLDIRHFEPVFSPFRGRRVGFVPLSGNVGDRLIDAAAEELMQHYGVPYRVIQAQELERGSLYFPLEAILVSGGGNMGEMYPLTVAQRCQALALGPPVTVLPQSFTDTHEDLAPYAGVFVRERASLKLVPNAKLAPDLALGLRPPGIDEGVEAKIGVWLREDGERKVSDAAGYSLGDPIGISWTIEDYLGLASKFEQVVTDRLHLAIAGLLLGRRVTLLPNGYAKNRSMYETWLRALGCRWRNAVDGIRCDRDETATRLWRRFAAPPSALLAWNSRPRRNAAWELIRRDDGNELRREGNRMELNSTAALIWSLMDGNWSVEEMCLTLAEQFEQTPLAVARDLQDTLRHLQHQGVLDIPPPDSPRESPTAARSPSRPCIQVEVLPPKKRHDRLYWPARVQGTKRGDFLHWFECDACWREALTPRADPFVLALLPRAMSDGLNLRVTGAPVDAALLDRLDEYQRVWQAWRPGQVQEVNIRADETVARSHPKRSALAAFSGGLDSMYTVFRHCVEPDGRRNLNLQAVVMGLGFDIPVNDRNGYQAAIARLRPAIDEAGIALIEVATNVRSHLQNWEMEHGAALASVLSLFSSSFGSGLIPSTAPYPHLFPWGSNPITDPLLGGSFDIRHDSAGVLRFEKLKALTRWPTALARLRVCWESRDPARNCGSCAKCCQLAMGLQALQAPLDCFIEIPSSARMTEFASKAVLSNLERLDISCILKAAGAISLREAWVAALSERLALPVQQSAPGMMTETDTTSEASP